MTEEVVLEGDGTGDEMEARLITELKRRGLLMEHVVDEAIVYDEIPPDEGSGHYRVRIETDRLGQFPG